MNDARHEKSIKVETELKIIVGITEWIDKVDVYLNTPIDGASSTTCVFMHL